MNLNSYIYVAAHAGFKSSLVPEDIPPMPFSHARLWQVPDYRKNDIPLYGEHLAEGVRLASQKPGTLLITSGGFNDPGYIGDAYDWSEAESYAIAGEKSGLYTVVKSKSLSFTTPKGNTLVVPYKEAITPSGETLYIAGSEYARDSLEEVLGGMVVFNLIAQKSAESATYVGWQFKAERFGTHAQTLKIPRDAFSYVGVNDPGPDDIQIAKEAEASTVAAFTKEPLGDTGELLKKRLGRDPLGRGNPMWDFWNESTRSV